ncbi:unnamed protein product [Plutella xylostella]|uniref:(diamondback moth) hypothetical protein n=1 Tax=Plutella xylostella TaxID=51655 RepID=A0A8S4FWK6_PLUXY|nr:unnamed protein product [Plutella xylostella]
MKEMRKMFSDLKAQQDRNIEKLQSTINEIKQQNILITESMEFMSAKYEEMKERVENIEIERKKNAAYVQLLEDKVENMKRQSRIAGIEIRNIPTQKLETKEILLKKVIDIGKYIGVSLDTRDIRDVFRIKNSRPQSTTNTVVVDFVSVIKKEQILHSFRQFNKSNQDKRLNTTLLNLDGPSQPIYVSESLTSKAKRLHYLARDFAKTNDWSYCWSSHGKIYLKKREGERYVLIHSESDLKKLETQK